MGKQRYDLKDRLVDYCVRIIRLSEALPNTRAGQHVCSQLLRSGTSPAPNYAEAQSGESRRDFVHKLKIALKELRETDVWLKIIARGNMIQPPDRLDELIRETDELIAVLFKSIETAKTNDTRGRSGPPADH